MEEHIGYTITEDDFYQSVGRYPKNREEFHTFVHYLKKGIDSQLDWDILYKCTKDCI
jgi:hypothetical protein